METPPEPPVKWGRTLLKRLDNLRQEGVFCDTLLETPDGSFFLAHSCVLAAASPFMYVQLVDLGLEASSLLIPVPGAALECCLHYIYSGEWKTSDFDPDELIEVASILGLPPVKISPKSQINTADESGVESCPDDGATPIKLAELKPVASLPVGQRMRDHPRVQRCHVQPDEQHSSASQPFTSHCSFSFSQISGDFQMPVSSAGKDSPSGTSHRCRYCMRSYQEKTELLKHEIWHKEGGGNKYDSEREHGIPLSHQPENNDREMSESHPLGEDDLASREFGETTAFQNISPVTSRRMELERLNFASPQMTNCPLPAHLPKCPTSLSRDRRYGDSGFYQCWVCSKSFKDRSRVLEHMDTHSKSSVDVVQHSSSSSTLSIQYLSRSRFTEQEGSLPSPSSLHDEDLAAELLRDSEAPVSSTVSKDNGEEMTPSKLLIDEETLKNGTTHQCSICNLELSSLACLRIHKQKTHHWHQRHLKCQYCHQFFTSLAQKRAHEESHTERMPFKCYFCDERFSWKKDKLVHEQIHREDERPFKCLVCQKSFTAKTSFVYHKRVHSGEKPFKCRYCTKTFTGSGNRNKHETTHTQAKHYKRLLCDKYFADSVVNKLQTSAKALIKQEQPVDTECETNAGNDGGNATLATTMADQPAQIDTISRQPNSLTQGGTAKPPEPLRDKGLCRKFHKCHKCKQCFTTRPELLCHKKVHGTGDRYRCQYCDRSFSSKPSLNCHVRLHSGEKPYHCHFCDESFVQTTSLRIHESKHTGHKPHACSFCGKTFVFRSAMTAHERTHTKERPYRCQFCDKAFVSSGSRRIHERTHTPKVPQTH